MARLWQCGYELNSFAIELGNAATGTGISIDSGNPRSGTYACKIILSSVLVDSYFQYLSAEGTSNRYFRIYIYFTTFPTAANRFIIFNDGTGAATPGVYLTIDNSGVIRLYDEDGQITGTTTLSTGTWYRLEVHIDTTLGAGSQVVEARIDGTNFASSSTRSIASTNQPFYLHLGGNLNSEAHSTGTWYYDDVAINDTSGSFQTSWPGEGEIIHLRPNAAGDNSDWTNDYTYVDEVTPDDATTLCASNTLNQVDDHNVDATPAAMESGDTINVVAVGVRYRGASSSANASFVARIKASASGTVEESAAITPGSTTWTTNANSAPKIYPLVTYDLPGASTTAWTKSDLDAAQVGYRCSTGNTNAANVTAIWISVDHKPAGGISVTPVAAACIASTTAPSVVLSSVTVTPAVAAAIASVVDPTAVLGSLTLTPDIAAAIARVIDPSVVLGSVGVVPDLASSIASVTDPSVVLSSIDVTPDIAAAIARVVDPDVSITGGDTVVTPPPATCIASVIDPTVVYSSVSVTPVASGAIAKTTDPFVSVSGDGGGVLQSLKDIWYIIYNG